MSGKKVLGGIIGIMSKEVSGKRVKGNFYMHV